MKKAMTPAEMAAKFQADTKKAGERAAPALRAAALGHAAEKLLLIGVPLSNDSLIAELRRELEESKSPLIQPSLQAAVDLLLAPVSR